MLRCRCQHTLARISVCSFLTVLFRINCWDSIVCRSNTTMSFPPIAADWAVASPTMLVSFGRVSLFLSWLVVRVVMAGSAFRSLLLTVSLVLRLLLQLWLCMVAVAAVPGPRSSCSLASAQDGRGNKSLNFGSMTDLTCRRFWQSPFGQDLTRIFIRHVRRLHYSRIVQLSQFVVHAPIVAFTPVVCSCVQNSRFGFMVNMRYELIGCRSHGAG